MEIKPILANVELEQVLLGGVLSNKEVLYMIEGVVQPDHFYHSIHQKIFSAALKLFEKNMDVDLFTVDAVLSKDLMYQDVGGARYIGKLIAQSVMINNSIDHAKHIYNLAIKRNLVTIGESVVSDTYGAELDIPAIELIEQVESKLFNLVTYGHTKKGFKHVCEGAKEAVQTINRTMKAKDDVRGVSTGFTELDKQIFGLNKSDLIILAGRPSMGKTALALNLTMNACKSLYAKHVKQENPPAIMPSVGFFSLEMSSEQLSTRLLSMCSGVDSSALRTGKLTESEYNAIRENAEMFSELPIYIDDTAGLTVSAIRTRARMLKRKHNLAVLFIDYLQLITGTGKRENRTIEISEITAGLKSLAKELDIPIIVLSQLSRAVESRDDKRPMLSDLRESGAIEQDADIVMFIYRDEYYLSRKQPEVNTQEYYEWQAQMTQVKNRAEVIVAKHRSGAIGNVSLHYDSHLSRFSNN